MDGAPSLVRYDIKIKGSTPKQATGKESRGCRELRSATA